MYVRRRRGNGMGDANCPSPQQMLGVTDASDPCQGGSGVPPCLAGAGPLAPGQSYCTPVVDPNNMFVHSMCFTPLVPFYGEGSSGTCVNAWGLSTPVAAAATVVLGLLVFKGLFGARR